jgi:hypothetical protein
MGGSSLVESVLTAPVASTLSTKILAKRRCAIELVVCLQRYLEKSRKKQT